MSCALAVFLKTPGLSPLKTRLAAGIGREAAERWYLLAADAVIAAAQTTPGIALHLALAEADDAAIAFWRTRYPDLARDAFTLQGEGELGERMARVHGALLRRHDAAMLIGADAPQIAPGDLAAARDWLAAGEPRLCMGPARDGGFWLVGANRPLPRSAWTAPRYSTPSAAAEFRAAAEGIGTWRALRELTDVDEADNLTSALNELDALDTPLPAQSRLIQSMRRPRQPRP